MEMLSTKQKTAIIIAGVVIVGIFIYYMTTKTNNYDYSTINEIAEEEPKEEEKQLKTEEVPEEIIVHITGAIEKEGIVKLKEGSRIIDAIEAAGGLTDEVNLEKVNLAYELKDGQKIYIPKISDANKEMDVNEEIDESVIINDEKEDNTGKVNINKAKVDELMTISGIGQSTAIKIIEYRLANGKFKTIEEIKNVSGIGELKYESIKDYICV